MMTAPRSSAKISPSRRCHSKSYNLVTCFSNRTAILKIKKIHSYQPIIWIKCGTAILSTASQKTDVTQRLPSYGRFLTLDFLWTFPHSTFLLSHRCVYKHAISVIYLRLDPEQQFVARIKQSILVIKAHCFYHDLQWLWLINYSKIILKCVVVDKLLHIKVKVTGLIYHNNNWICT